MENSITSQAGDHPSLSDRMVLLRRDGVDSPALIDTVHHGSGGSDSGYSSLNISPDSNDDTRCESSFSTFEVSSGLLFQRVTVKIFNGRFPDEVVSRFRDLKQFISGPLFRHLFQDGTTPSPVSVTLRYMGRDVQSAVPVLFVMCEPRIAKKARSFFKQSHIKDQCRSNSVFPDRPSFKVFIYERAPQEIAGSAPIEVRALMPEYSFRDHAMCGTLIYAQVDGKLQYSTIGGLVEVSGFFGSTIYAMTVEHFLRAPTRGTGDTMNHLSQAQEASHCRFSSDSMIVHFERLVNHANIIDDDDHDSVFADAFEIENRASDNDHTNEIVQTDIHNKTEDELTDLGGKTCYYIHTVNSGPGSQLGGTRLDWTLIEVAPGSKPLDRNYVPLVDSKRQVLLAPNGADNLPGLGALVIVYAGTAGPIYGVLSETPAMYAVGCSEYLIETYLLALEPDAVLKPGDCGSWVVDASTGEVYGQVVAGDDLRTYYVVPLSDIFEEIRERFGNVSITLPQPMNDMDVKENYGHAATILPFLEHAGLVSTQSQYPYCSYQYPRAYEASVADSGYGSKDNTPHMTGHPPPESPYLARGHDIRDDLDDITCKDETGTELVRQ